GTKDVLGIWIEQNEGAKFWLKVMNELRNRGVEDILIAVVDGLKGFPEAITTVFPLASVQTSIAHRAATQLDRSPVFADYYLIVVKSSCHVWRFRLDHALRRRLVGFDSASESLAKHAHRTEFHCSGKL